MTPEEARVILEKAEYWHYRFKFPWGETIPTRKGWAERVELRKKHFFLPLVKRYEGTLAGKRVLDLGCCQGYWSFAAQAAGAKLVRGLDSNIAFVQEAEAAALLLGMDRCFFGWTHLEDEPLDAWVDGGMDITLFLGTLYHLTDPIHVLRKAMANTRETIVIDGEVVPGDSPTFHLQKRTPGEPTTIRSGATSDLRTIPTVAAIRELLLDGGFKKINVLKPAADAPADYHAGTTASIIASRD